jgi:hypothetical protein
MTDKPYGLDFFHKITDVHFGNNWLNVSTSVPFAAGVTNTVKVDFPNQAGGTPGFNLIPAPGSFPSDPHTVTASDLSHRLITGAGAPVTGFGTKSGPNNSQVYLKLDKFFPTSVFGVRVSITRSGTVHSNTLIKIGTIKSSGMKAGLVTPIPLFSSQQALSLSGNGTFNFSVNPSTLQVTGPF